MNRRITILGTLVITTGLLTYILVSSTAKKSYLKYAEHEATMMQRLTNSYVNEYNRIRQNHPVDELPVPASFRARALAQFDSGLDKNDAIQTSMVGVPGLEIRTPPTDEHLADFLTQMMQQSEKTNHSILITKSGSVIHRNIFPSIANSNSCVYCHNKLQKYGNSHQWQLGDLMGAYIVDRNVDKPFSQFQRLALLIAVLSTLLSSAIAMIIFYAQQQHRFAIKLNKLATTDPLTGCINRREMQNRLTSTVDLMTGCLLLLDLDKFKNINDTYGHQAGDKVLVDFATRTTTLIRSNDWIARIGGEEFAIWLSHATPEQGQIVGERIREQAEKAQLNHEGTVIPYTVSIGVRSVSDSCPADFENWLQDADELLYKAKESGRNCVQFKQAA